MSDTEPSRPGALFTHRVRLVSDDAAAMVLGQPDPADADREAIRWHGCDHGHAWIAGVCGRCGVLRGLLRPATG